MEIGLFLEISEQQQEITSGGGQLVDLFEYDNTNFEFQNFNLSKTMYSGPYGSVISKDLTNKYIDTSAYEFLNADFE
ncbi:hypothetical protein AMR41_05350 [Hapalosiphon sp. MRB220]|nr:hypothetical protein AMR41_05350 [Hapalosiphon sp. MRB220]